MANQASHQTFTQSTKEKTARHARVTFREFLHDWLGVPLVRAGLIIYIAASIAIWFIPPNTRARTILDVMPLSGFLLAYGGYILTKQLQMRAIYKKIRAHVEELRALNATNQEQFKNFVQFVRDHPGGQIAEIKPENDKWKN